jgi:hypothetical protein
MGFNSAFNKGVFMFEADHPTLVLWLNERGREECGTCWKKQINTYRIFVENAKGKKPTGRPKHK